jgi:hypothetical protein
MEIPYKGYTITPSSERQPDGRWLPVAELEIVHRGIVTTKPALRATSREVRAARADADAAAVVMAKAWIDANERKDAAVPASPPPPPPDRGRAARAAPPPPVPVAREAPPPPTPPETRAPQRAEAAPRGRTGGEKRRPAAPDKLDWAGLCQAVGLDADEKLERLTRLLMAHALLDRLVTLLLAARITPGREPRAVPDVDKVLGDIAPLAIPARVDLASALGVLAPAVAQSILEVDRVRNRLVQAKPARGKPVWDVSDIEEVASPDASDTCLRKAIAAAHELLAAIRVKATET